MDSRSALFHQVFMDVAQDMSRLSTCEKRTVGAVAVIDRRIVSVGYNGAPKGAAHVCHIVNGKCTSCVHAEINAVIQGALHGISLAGSTVYCTLAPCGACASALVNAGVVRVVYLNVSGSAPDGLLRLDQCGVEHFRHERIYE